MAPRTPLLRPDRYFAERRLAFARGLAVVAVLTVALVASVYAMGWVFTERIDGTVTVDNPARPSDTFCEDDFFNASGCDEPRTIERDIDAIIGPAMDQLAWDVVWLMPAGWLLVGALLHAASWLAGGEGSVSRTLTVAAWGMAPTLASMAVVLAMLAATFDPVTVTPADDPSAFRRQLFASIDALQTVGPIVAGLTTVWGGVIWRFGLERARRLSGAAATRVAGAVTLLLLLLGLL